MIIVLILCVLLKEDRLQFRSPFERRPQQQQPGKRYEENNSKQKQNNTIPKTNHTQRESLFLLNEWLIRHNYTRALKMLNLRVSNLTRPTDVSCAVEQKRKYIGHQEHDSAQCRNYIKDFRFSDGLDFNPEFDTTVLAGVWK